MKFRYILFFFALVFNNLNAQNFSVSQYNMPRCFGDCDGSVTFTTGAVTGPFTAILTNTGSCPNSTVQTSNLNSITINSLCGCSAPYSVSIYNPSMALVGTMVQNMVNYATGPLAVNVNTVTPTTCTNCCDGNITFTVTGGNLTNPPTYSINGTFTANVSPLYFLCVGQHTVCVEDASGCIVCKTFIMPYNGMPMSVKEQETQSVFSIYPNPGNGLIFIRSSEKNLIRSAEIRDLSGRIIQIVTNVGNDQSAIQLSALHLENGMYQIRVLCMDNSTYSQLYIKNSD